MPRFAAITHEGIEDISAQEISETLSVNATHSPAMAIFDAERLEACRFCYEARSVQRVVEVLAEGHIAGLEDIRSVADNMYLGEWIDTDSSFAVRCMRRGDQGFSSKEAEEAVGGRIHTHSGAGADLEHPDIPVLVFVKDDYCIIGIDYANRDLSKRAYHLFTTASNIKGAIAYALVRLSGYQADGVLLDPFCGAGNMVIEAGLYARGISPHFFQKEEFAFRTFPQFSDNDFDELFEGWDELQQMQGTIYGYDDQLRHVRSAKQNAKVAGLSKEVTFSKVEAEWLDTKLSQDEVMHVVSHPPQVSRYHSEKEARKIYVELFYNLDYVAQNDASLVFVCNRPEPLLDEAGKYSYATASERWVYQGQKSLRVLTLNR